MRSRRRSVVRAPARDLAAFAKRAGYKVVRVFQEHASGARRREVGSASSTIELARRREINAVLVRRLSRCRRSTADLIGTLDNLHGWGVSVLALKAELRSRHRQRAHAGHHGDARRVRARPDPGLVKSSMAAAKAQGKHCGLAPRAARSEPSPRSARSCLCAPMACRSGQSRNTSALHGDRTAAVEGAAGLGARDSRRRQIAPDTPNNPEPRGCRVFLRLQSNRVSE
jgi:hypothetical protein